MNARRISTEALDLLKRWEGCVLHAYDDADPARPPRFVQSGDPVRGTLTIGYGHTRSVRPGQRITQAEAERLLLEDLAPVEAAIARSVTVPLTDGQHGALVSFAFNLGHSTAPIADDVACPILVTHHLAVALSLSLLLRRSRRGGRLRHPPRRSQDRAAG